MRIAFDLDDTLIPVHRDSFAVELPCSWWGRRFVPELIRSGAPQLLRALRRRGCEIWVYTTSMRSPFQIWLTLFCYGVRLSGVVNEDRHRKWLRSKPHFPSCSKYPPAFGIDLIIDDSEGVVIEGRELFFRVVHVAPSDEDWMDSILAEVNRSFDPPITLQ